MILRGKGKFLIVDVEEDTGTQGSITVVSDETSHFAIGKVVVSGPYVVVDEGAEVIIDLANARPLGLGYPNSYKVVDGEKSLVAVWEPEEEESDEETG